MKIRLITLVNTLDVESFIFTEDFFAPAEDWTTENQGVEYDEILDLDLPNYFPLEHELTNAFQNIGLIKE